MLKLAGGGIYIKTNFLQSVSSEISSSGFPLNVKPSTNLSCSNIAAGTGGTITLIIQNVSNISRDNKLIAQGGYFCNGT